MGLVHPRAESVKPSGDLYEYLRWWEGRVGKPVLTAYKDSRGRWTIGYGSTRGVVEGMTITLGEAEQRLSAAVGLTADAVEYSLAGLLNQQQFDSLVSLTYNIGVSAFRTSSPCALVKAKLYHRVGPAMELWCNVTNPVTGVLEPNKGLIRRRAADRAIFDHGDYSGRP